jgi:hypothetical protein
MDIDQTLAKLESYEQELLEMWLGVSNCIGALYVMHGKKRVYRMVPKSTIGSCVEQPIGSELEK